MWPTLRGHFWSYNAKLNTKIFEEKGSYICICFIFKSTVYLWERSGSVEECLTGDRGAAGSSLNGVAALCPEQDTFILA